MLRHGDLWPTYTPPSGEFGFNFAEIYEWVNRFYAERTDCELCDVCSEGYVNELARIMCEFREWYGEPTEDFS